MAHSRDLESGFEWETGGCTCAHPYLLPVVFKIIDDLKREKGYDCIFDLGCGNGSAAQAYHQRGFKVRGVDPSEDGIRQARKAYPSLRLEKGSAYDKLSKKYGAFPIVTSLEVVEHVFLPRVYAKCLFDLVIPGGVAILSSPFHGYWKNLAIALAGGFDRHVNPLWDYGHIKFWSVKTLSKLLVETGFEGDLRFFFVGRTPLMAKSMIVAAKKPK